MSEILTFMIQLLGLVMICLHIKEGGEMRQERVQAKRVDQLEQTMDEVVQFLRTSINDFD
jgi:hypothetical protein